MENSYTIKHINHPRWIADVINFTIKLEHVDSTRDQYEIETGKKWINSQGEPDIDYVIWLEALISRMRKTPEIKQ